MKLVGVEDKEAQPSMHVKWTEAFHNSGLLQRRYLRKDIQIHPQSKQLWFYLLR